MTIDILKKLYQELSRDIEFIATRLIIYYNSKRIRGLIFLKRDLVYLLRKNIKIKRLNSKLDYTKLRLYKIKKVLEKIIYKLELFNIMRIHLIFYIFLLELIFKNAK